MPSLSAGTGIEPRERYAGAMAGLWSGLGRTLARLEAVAASPPERLAGAALGELPSLQYGLHAAGELALGIEPPPGAEIAHAELAAALADARDATAELVEAVESGGGEAAAALVHEWRGALFRVRLARLRLSARAEPPAAPAEPSMTRRYSPLAVTLLVLAGVAAFAAGARLAFWPAWAAGLAFVAAGLLAYRPE